MKYFLIEIHQCHIFCVYEFLSKKNLAKLQLASHWINWLIFLCHEGQLWGLLLILNMCYEYTIEYKMWHLTPSSYTQSHLCCHMLITWDYMVTILNLQALLQNSTYVSLRAAWWLYEDLQRHLGGERCISVSCQASLATHQKAKMRRWTLSST